MNKLTIMLFFILLTQMNFAQPGSLITKNISTESQITVKQIGNRGLLKNGNVYFVEDDLQTISGYNKNKKIWQVNIIKILGKPKAGRSAIHYIKLSDKSLHITYGKHNFAVLNIENGEIISHGAE
ncbi:hypothetical protein HYN48_13245 [Flavobacterium magnum]|uniref:Uncharacterized protein n=1 Tax=Flavobacterium magnum TaxID=2162713 RepID=A0A2S0RH74_9FLAO|nr:hypothetical protein [Flavobacterium magnum]AWA30965.1 hypothetical protein HYN48_13245 [Flavobacterium magnum]